MKKISNMTIILATIALLGGLIIAKTSINYVQNHDRLLIMAMETKVQYYAKRCYLEGNCNDKFTLNDLYTKGYITEIVNPVTKEIMDYNTNIAIVNDEVQIYWTS